MNHKMDQLAAMYSQLGKAAGQLKSSANATTNPSVLPYKLDKVSQCVNFVCQFTVRPKKE